MSIEVSLQTIKKNMGWRYLDSLDSVRYSQDYITDFSESIPIRLVPAQLDFMRTILWGHGITVPNNVLFDSVGFLQIASNLVRVVEKFEREGKTVFCPIRFTLFNYNKPEISDGFMMAADRFSAQKFKLSAWPSLNSEYTVRLEWAKSLERREPIPANLTKGISEQAEQLYKVLGYFSTHADQQIQARPTKGDREELMNAVANIDQHILEKAKQFKNLTSKQLDICIDLIRVFKNLQTMIDDEGKSFIDDRSLINEAIKTRIHETFAGTGFLQNPSEIGILRIIDGIYNISNAIGAWATQDSHSREAGPKVFRDPTRFEEMEMDWDEYEAGFALESWARQYANEVFPKKYDNGIVKFQALTSLNTALPEEEYNIPNSRRVWENFFEIQRSDSWISSINNYINCLNALERNKKQKKGVDDSLNRYKEARQNHEDLVKQVLEDSVNLKDGKITIENGNGVRLAESPTEDYGNQVDESEYIAKAPSDDSIKYSILN